MKLILTEDLIFRFEGGNFLVPIESDTLRRVNDLLDEEMKKHPIEHLPFFGLPPRVRLIKYIERAVPKEETAKTILEEILRLVQQSDEEITSQVRVASIEREIEKAKKLLGKL